MKYSILLFPGIIIIMISCSRKIFDTNGETIYRTGRNLQGEKLLDKGASSIKIVSSCKTCHGKNGDSMKRSSIKFSVLSNPRRFAIPYTDSLFFRFLDHDLKSDGSKANIGVIWKMSKQDKVDLLAYLKTL
ncbi:MAG: hypothetical protein H7Y86_08570 [Rhizobacter sp.]|nr:hypothetical protein [Ferruginibacter sp.]